MRGGEIARPGRFNNLIRSMRALGSRLPRPGRFFFPRLANLGLSVLDARRRPAAPLSRPIFVDVVITTSCNMKCIMCERLDTSTAFMEPALFRKVAADLFPTASEVFFCSGGEQLLHPHFGAYLEICRAYGVRIRILTNGLLLDGEQAALILAAGVDWLGISFDGATPATLADIRRGADFDRIVANIAALQEAKTRRGSRRPEFYFMYALLKRNLGELPAFIELAARLGVGRVQANYLALTNDLDEDELVYFHREEAQAAFREAGDVARRLGVTLDLPPADFPAGKTGVCSWPWRFVWVFPDGRVFPCYQIRPPASFGSIAAGTDFGALWNAAPLRRQREGLRRGEAPLPSCEVCSVRRGYGFKEAHYGPAKLAAAGALKKMAS